MLLDSNVWRYVVDEKANGALLNFARNGRFEILIAPAVLYEALRLKDALLRNTLIQLMTHRAFFRPMPEAYSEAMEILDEIKSLRPAWLRDEPDLQFFSRLEADWRKKTGGFWVRCKRWPEREAELVCSSERDTMSQAHAQAKTARLEIMKSNWKRNPPMDKTYAMFQSPVAGWKGDEFEAWRMDALTSLTFALKQTEGAYYDWLAPFIKLDAGLLESGDWTAFWVYDADKSRVPRQWLRWAFSFAQRFRTTTPGTPADSQLSTYFLESDLVVTADQALLEILEEVRPYAPCKLPFGHLIPGGTAGVQSLFEKLAN